MENDADDRGAVHIYRVQVTLPINRRGS